MPGTKLTHVISKMQQKLHLCHLSANSINSIISFTTFTEFVSEQVKKTRWMRCSMALKWFWPKAVLHAINDSYRYHQSLILISQVNLSPLSFSVQTVGLNKLS